MDGLMSLEIMAGGLETLLRTVRDQIALHRAAEGEKPSGKSKDVVERARVLHPSLGPRQAEILREVEKAGADGATTGKIARAINYDQPNVYLTLHGLIGAGLIEKDESTRPHRYRLQAILILDEGEL